jgi:hypothetical protein
MKIKNTNINYYIMLWDSNKNSIKRNNIIDDELIESIAKEVRKNKITSLNELQEYLKREFMYYYWSKSECEITVGGLSTKHPEYFQKLDGWYQIEKNLPMITNYINYEMRLELK